MTNPLTCLECSTDIYPGQDGYDEELCPKHYRQAHEIVVYNCPVCKVKVARPESKCQVCISKEQFEKHSMKYHLMRAGVPPRTAQVVSKAYNPSESSCLGSLYFYGPPGTGKTFQAVTSLLGYLRRYACDQKHFSKRKKVKFVTVPELLNNIRCSFGKPIVETDNKTFTADELILRAYKNVDVLVLDDLGVENTTDWVFTTLYLIINYRYEHNKTTIFTSNFSLEELAEKLKDSRLTSRIRGWCKVQEFKDKDYRIGQVK